MASLCGGIFLFKVVENVTYTQTVTAHLVGVCRTDTLARGSNFRRAFEFLVGSVKQTVCRHYQVCLFRYFQNFLDIDAAFFQIFCFFSEKHRVEHYAISDYVHLPMLENS